MGDRGWLRGGGGGSEKGRVSDGGSIWWTGLEGVG